MAFCVSAGVQHVPGDAGGFHPGPQGGPAGLALCAAHSAAEEDGRRPAGLGAGQSSESARRHTVGGTANTRVVTFFSIFLKKMNIETYRRLFAFPSWQGVFPQRPPVHHPHEVHRGPDADAQPEGERMVRMCACFI